MFAVPLAVYGLSRRKFRVVLVKVAIIGTVLGGVWDYIAVNFLKLWFFNPDTLLGVWLLGLPLEEWLFFIFVSMSVSTLALSIAKR